MMESFGVNLQRKLLYDRFSKTHSQIESITKRKDTTQQDLENIVQNTGEFMKRII